MTPLSIAIGARLRWARLDANLRLEDVAKLTGSHRPIVGRTERGLHTPDVAKLGLHAAAVRLDVAELGRVVDGVLAACGAAAFVPVGGPRLRTRLTSPVLDANARSRSAEIRRRAAPTGPAKTKKKHPTLDEL